MALVVETIRRTASGNAKNGMTRVPVPPPGGRDGGVLGAPGAGLERLERGQTRVGVLGAVDRPQLRDHGLPILPGDEVQGMADQMNDAGLNHGVGE